MKLDMDLVRQLLFFFESKAGRGHILSSDIKIEGRDDQDVFQYHLARMYEAGFLVCELTRSKSTPDRTITVIPFELTWSGHQFLETIRDDEVWRRVKAGAYHIGNFSFEVLKDVAKGIVRKKLKEWSDLNIEV